MTAAPGHPTLEHKSLLRRAELPPPVQGPGIGTEWGPVMHPHALHAQAWWSTFLQFCTFQLPIPLMAKLCQKPGPIWGGVTGAVRCHSGPIQTLGRTQYVEAPVPPGKLETFDNPGSCDRKWAPPKASLPVASINPCHSVTDQLVGAGI